MSCDWLEDDFFLSSTAIDLSPPHASCPFSRRNGDTQLAEETLFRVRAELLVFRFLLPDTLSLGHVKNFSPLHRGEDPLPCVSLADLFTMLIAARMIRFVMALVLHFDLFSVSERVENLGRNEYMRNGCEALVS
ncbi:hypothetical protein Nepgr_033936 [Nepenthes gracilis]|uniref:Uncharacterized protein n=1 Tax=Nepenthes gracilis TaxID=150966 RepID=A0AAD3TMB7_NEPGR|nr:hypothetical protein Nepgr_033936 [Nepenthes gracilis]